MHVYMDVGGLPPITLSFLHAVRLVTYGAVVFCVAGPASLFPNNLKETNSTYDLFKRQQKTYRFCTYIRNHFLLALP